MSHLRDEGSIVTVTPPPVLTDDVVTSILQGLEGCLMRGSSYVLIFDLSQSGTPNPLQRATLASHMRKNKPRIERSVRAMAVVAPSPIVRGVLTAIFWLEPPPVKHQVFANESDAKAWARWQANPKVRS